MIIEETLPAPFQGASVACHRLMLRRPLQAGRRFLRNTILGLGLQIGGIDFSQFWWHRHLVVLELEWEGHRLKSMLRRRPILNLSRRARLQSQS